MSFPLLAAGAPAAGPAGAPAGGTQGFLLQMAPMLLIFAVFYFVLIRPQQQRQKELARMVGDLKKGDEVVTSGGIVGTVWAVKDDRVVLQVQETKLDFIKSSIVTVNKPGA